MTDLPIACTLTPDSMTTRLSLIDALAADGLLERTATDAGLRVRLRDTAEIEQRTRELVAAESKCCAFLDFELGREGDTLVLDISGPEDARPVIDMFFLPGDQDGGAGCASRTSDGRSLRRTAGTPA